MENLENTHSNKMLSMVWNLVGYGGLIIFIILLIAYFTR